MLCIDHWPAPPRVNVIPQGSVAHKEMHHHTYNECSTTEELRKARDREVLKVINKYIMDRRISSSDLPLWFTRDTNTSARGQSTATTALRRYNVQMGVLAFCLKQLPKALEDVGVPDHKLDWCITEVLGMIAKSVEGMWLLRTTALKKQKNAWKTGRDTP